MTNKPQDKRYPLKRNFILQQGFADPGVESCSLQFSALQFQPRVIGVWLLLGIVLQWPGLFLVLSAVLWWNAFLPAWNPFDHLYNRIFTASPGALRLGPAPPPRRFAQGLAASLSLAIGILLLLEYRLAAYAVEGILALAVAALIFPGFCFGSFVFHNIRRRISK